MAKERFIERRFSASSLSIIDHANSIVEIYRSEGFILTLRQIYYQFVSRSLIPNKQSEYKRLGSIINDARLAGLLDWSAIEDRTRNVRSVAAWSSPQDIIDVVASQYKEPQWATQPYVPEVWIEKDALIGVIEPICESWRVPFFACRGYASQSEVYAAGKRFQRLKRGGQIPLVLHLGDHDPSGIDMTRDNDDRLAMFARSEVEVRRLALNRDQIDRHNPPPNPAKDTDARFTGYQQEHGDESWELDALEPTIISTLIDDEIRSIVNLTEWDETTGRERRNRELLQRASYRWDDISEMLSTQP